MRARLIRGLPLITALSIGVWGVGCGSSSSTTAEPTAAPTRAVFLKQGNAICAKGEKQQQEEATAYMLKNGAKGDWRAEQNELVEAVLLPNIQTQLDALKALGAPSGEEQRVSAALETAQRTMDKFRANPALFYGNESLTVAVAKRLHALGLKECAPNN